MRVFLTAASLSVLDTAEVCDTPQWVRDKFLPTADEFWYKPPPRNKRYYADVTEEERDRLVLLCAWAGDNTYSQRHDGQYNRNPEFGPSMYDVIVREARLMWRTADRLAAQIA